MKTLTPSLKNASQEVQLAVDLIYLLEINKISPDIALKSLKIVENDLRTQLEQKQVE